jgi:predicted CoA-binding protein
MSVFPPEGDEKGYLVFRRLEGTPERVDMVAIFRPEKETAGILEKHVLPLKAKAVWFLRSVDSEEERELVARSGIRVIENADIVAVARIIAREKRSGG